MNKKNIFVSVVMFVIAALLALPLFAEGNKLDRAELENSIREAARTDVKSSQKLEYFQHDRSLNCKGMRNINESSVMKKLKSRGPINLCEQYDIMNYFIQEGDNANLQKVLDAGYKPSALVAKEKGSEERGKTLLAQAVLSNNKEAFVMLYDKLEEIHKKLPSESEFLGNMYFDVITLAANDVSFYCDSEHYPSLCGGLKLMVEHPNDWFPNNPNERISMFKNQLMAFFTSEK